MSRDKIVWVVVLLTGAMGLPAAAQGGYAAGGASQNAGTQSASTAASGGPVSMAATSSSSSSSSLSVPSAPKAGAPIVSGSLPPAREKQDPVEQKRVLPFSKLAISTKSSTLGAGGQIATPLMRTLNLRGGADFFNFGAGATIDEARYEGQVHLKGGQVSLDWFPFGQFHISPGIVIFKSAFSAGMYVPGGNTFDLGDNTFTSSVSDPITGNANIIFSHSIMPSLTVGIGNMITRDKKHWSVPLEVGAAYTGHYTVQMALKGTACINVGCLSTSSTIVQQSLLQEEQELNEPMKHYQIYPILSSGISYRF